MIYFLSIVIIYLVSLVFYGAYAHDKVENFHMPYEETELERKTRSLKERYVLCSLRLLSK
jgi:hypothetical protein